MPVSTDPPEADIEEEANLRLSEGLTSCRSVVKNYRAMILGEETPADDADQQVKQTLPAAILPE